MILPRNHGSGLILNTVVSVYANDASVQHCGTITELQSGDWPNDLTYYVDCGGVSGDMVHLTDLDTTACCSLYIAEVAIYGYESIIIIIGRHRHLKSIECANLMKVYECHLKRLNL